MQSFLGRQLFLRTSLNPFNVSLQPLKNQSQPQLNPQVMVFLDIFFPEGCVMLKGQTVKAFAFSLFLHHKTEFF